MAGKNLKQAEVAKLFGLKQPDVSALLHDQLTKFALERLLRFLTLLGLDVAIVVKSPSGKRPARMTFEGIPPVQREV